MKQSSRSDAETYVWLQRGMWNYDFALQHEGREIGTLKATSWSRQEYEGSTAEGTWVFRQEGFWKRVIVCEDASTRQRLGTFRPKWSASEGELELWDGRKFKWTTSGFLDPVSTLADQRGTVMLELHQGNSLQNSKLSRFFKVGATISLASSGLDRRTSSLLCLVAWHLSLCSRDETIAAVTVATTS
jgi:hypothetical protein